MLYRNKFPSPISYSEAIEAIEQNIKPLSKETVSIFNSFNRVIAKSPISQMSLPQSNISAMDGYALSSNANPDMKYILNTDTEPRAQRVLTGQPVPDWAFCVAAEEVCIVEKNTVCTLKTFKQNTNIRPAGEDIQIGSTLIDQGAIINSAIACRLASVGTKNVEVFRKPKVAIITTGNELVSIQNTNCGPDQRYECDSIILTGLLKKYGADVVVFPHLTDDYGIIMERLKEACKYDMVITCGGASNSEADHIRPALQELGVSFMYERVHMKPGRPTGFALLNSKTPIFVLPGNPVAVYVTFLALALPALNILSGINLEFNKVLMPPALSAVDIKADKIRERFIRVSLTKKGETIFATPYPNSGSGLIRSLTESDAIAFIPSSKCIKKGDRIKIFHML